MKNAGSQINIDDISRVKTYLTGLQNRICHALEGEEPEARFIEDAWSRLEGGGGITKLLSNGTVVEQGGVNFLVIQLPPRFQRLALASSAIQSIS